MISDITLGQFFPGKSAIHRMDPRMKICLTVFFIVLTFCARNFVNIALVYGVVFAGIFLSKVPMKMYLKSLKPILFIVAFTAVLNLFYGTGEPLIELGFIKITLNGILNSILIAVRIVALILVSSILTFTTSPTQLTDAIERLLKPLTYIKVPVHEFRRPAALTWRAAASCRGSKPSFLSSSRFLSPRSDVLLTWPQPWRAAVMWAVREGQK